MTEAVLETLIRAGGFAVLAAVAIYSNVKIVDSFSKQIQQSHEREMEALKTLTDDRKEMLIQLGDLIKDVQGSLQGLQDEIYILTRGKPRNEG